MANNKEKKRMESGDEKDIEDIWEFPDVSTILYINRVSGPTLILDQVINFYDLSILFYSIQYSSMVLIYI